ncbi:uncharacterized protein LOC129577748 [Sitodiplosis mosellana]|uniref:uncharacterized protein LOC129577748 n=1 Tax=Sitodiplosis mosellana TaxID=263140 RepID=UPI002443846F|nr:uncharacterized protein LOC129577748 [Sitodiplosis mosellana]XP_055321244.1 uncharacterized protein LOC129577748 [Sitodiplosis mosellana]
MQTMFKWICFIAHILLHTNHIEQCVGDAHSITGSFYNGYDGTTFLERTLFTRNTTMPKSYVVGFKYVSDIFGRDIYNGIIHSDAQNTWGGGDLGTVIDIHDTRYLNANIHIPNATKFEVDIQLKGIMGIGYTGMERFLGINVIRPRSYALICAINEKKSHTKYRELVFGERKDGDAVLYARAESFASSNSELPRHNIEFEDNSAILTAASIRLNSTAAIVFHNKVQLTAHRFSATVYALNRDTIADVVIIYGHRTY